MKKFLSVLLSVLCVAGMTPIANVAAEETSTIENEAAEVVKLNDYAEIIKGEKVTVDVTPAFDGNKDTGTPFGGNTNEYYAGIKLDEPATLSHVTLLSGQLARPDRIFLAEIEGSNDGINWEPILQLGDVYDEYEDYAADWEADGTQYFMWTEYAFDGGAVDGDYNDDDAAVAKAYSYYRVFNTDNDNWGEIEFWGTFGEAEVVPGIQVLQGTIIKSEAVTVDVAAAFDGDIATYLNLGGAGENYWMGIELEEAVVLSHVRLATGDFDGDGKLSNNKPWHIHLTVVEGSNNGETWDYIMKFGDDYSEYEDYAADMEAGNNYWTEFAFAGENDEYADEDAEEPVAYKYYRVWNADGSDNWGEVEFWGNPHVCEWEEIVLKEQTCTEVGVLKKVCAGCGEVVYEQIPVHTPEDVIKTEATCGAAGLKDVKCSVCGEIIEENVEIPATEEHAWENDAVLEATCTTPAMIARHCTVCDLTEDEYIIGEALGHEWEHVDLKEPTCTEEGYIDHYVCAVCGEKDGFEVMETLPHDYEENIVAPTCSAVGYSEKTCTVCGDYVKSEETTAIDPEAHKETIGQVLVAPTCDTVGHGKVVCELCNKDLEKYAEIPAGHAFDITEEQEFPCVEGVRTYTCTVCDAVETEVIETTAEHDYSIVDVVVGATCQDPAYVAEECSVCGHRNVVYDDFDESIVTIPHTWVDVAEVKPTCTEAGKTAGKECSVCGEHTWQELNSLGGHTIVDTVVAPTCSTEGYTTHICSVCGFAEETTDVTETVPENHTPVALESTAAENIIKEATCYSDGVIKVVCDECDAFIEYVTVEMLAHTFDIATSNDNGSAVFERCSICGAFNVVVLDEDAIEHAETEECTIVVDPAVEPTYTSTGLTEGKHCARCGDRNADIFVPQVVIPALVAPETEAPETQAPETQAPETEAPETVLANLVGLGEIIKGEAVTADVTLAFDGNKDTATGFGGTSNEYWAGIKLDQAVILSHVSLLSGQLTRPDRIFLVEVEGSNDGINWEPILQLGDNYAEYEDYAADIEANGQYFMWTEIAFDGESDEDDDATAPKAYSYYRVFNTDNDNYGEVEFWGYVAAADVPETEAPETEAPETTVANINANGEIITSSANDVSAAFDGNVATSVSLGGSGNGAWMGIKLEEATILSHVRLATGDNDGDGKTDRPHTIFRSVVEGSNDGENWTFIMDFGDDYSEYEDYAADHEAGENYWTEYAVEPVAYTYYRVWNGDDNDFWGEVEFWGFVEATDAPETEAPETEAPETNAPETAAPETEAPETQAPETQAPETEAPVVDADVEFTLGNVVAMPGDEIAVELVINSKVEINSIALFDLTFDSDVLSFVGFAGYEDFEATKCAFPGCFMSDRMVITIPLKAPEALTGTICTLVFKINDAAALDTITEITMSSIVKNSAVEITSAVNAAKVKVGEEVLGDIGGDKVVDIQDVVALFQSIMLPEDYAIDNYLGSVDFNNDGELSIQDALALFQYILLPDLYPIA